MMNEVRIITTGGTFDKQYDAIKGELTFTHSQLLQILDQSRCTLRVAWEKPLAVDSLYMTEEQRSTIVNDIKKSPEKRVIVIHGTDTMVKTAIETAHALGQDDDHVVVFTGAMIPFALEKSDASFNLGMAVSAVQLLETGVYVAMSGRIFPWNHAIKNKAQGVFEWV